MGGKESEGWGQRKEEMVYGSVAVSGVLVLELLSTVSEMIIMLHCLQLKILLQEQEDE